MTEVELLDTFRRNLLPNIQDRLVQINSLRDLQTRVQQVEELTQNQSEVQHIWRSVPRVHKITAYPHASLDQNLVSNYSYPSVNLPHSVSEISYPSFNSYATPADSFAHTDQQCVPDDQRNFMCAMVASNVDRNQYTLCWNCRDMGHTLMDCTAQRNVFCYGCGKANVVNPQCPKCSLRFIQGNGRRNVRPMVQIQAGLRPDSQTFHLNSQQPPRPN